MERCLKVISLFKELQDEMHKLTRLEFEMLLAGLEQAQLNDRKKNVRKLQEEERRKMNEAN